MGMPLPEMQRCSSDFISASNRYRALQSFLLTRNDTKRQLIAGTRPYDVAIDLIEVSVRQRRC